MTPPNRTYGTLRHRADGAFGPIWVVEVEPHVAMRVKRLFRRVRQERSGAIVIADTLDVARDLEWLLHRYPLEMDTTTAARLESAADAHRRRDEQIVQVLSGHRIVHGLREPVRPPRDYQTVAADLAHTTGRLLVADELGLGKTFTALLLLRDPDTLPALVVTMTHLPEQWVAEIGKSLPWLTSHILTKTTPYDLTRPDGTQPDVIISNYHKLAGWADHLAGRVNTVIFDEVQELRHGTSSNKGAAAAMIAQATIPDGWRMGLSATPVYNYGFEIFNIMDVLAPGELGTRDEFLREWCDSGLMSNKIRVADPRALGTHLREHGLMLRRTRTEVGQQLPPVITIPQQVDADRDVYTKAAGDAAEIARLILAQTTAQTDRWRMSSELDWRMRQATGIAKAPYTAAFVEMLLEQEERIVLFGWHRAVYDVWAQMLAPHNPVFYTGTESPTQKRAAVEQFMAGNSRVLIMSLRSGAGLDGLQHHADVVVIGELPWTNAEIDQGIGRLHRPGRHADAAPVVAYILHADEGADPVILDALQIKRAQSEPMLDPDARLFEPAADPDRIRRLAETVLADSATPLHAKAS